MGYNLNYNSIRTLQTVSMSSVISWEEECSSVLEDLVAFVNETSFSGAAADAIRQYIADTHLPICQSLLVLLSEYKARFALFVSGLYEYDGNKYANINEDALREVEEQLQKAGYDLTDFRTQVMEEMTGISDLGVESMLKSPEVYVAPLQEEIQKISSLRNRVGEYEQTAFHETEGLQEYIAELLQVVQKLQEQGEMDISGYEPGCLVGMPALDRLQVLTENSWTFQTENQEAIEAAYAHYTEVWEEIIDEIREQRIKKGCILVIFSAVGIIATVATFGALGPEAISMETAILGSFALAYDVSNMEEGIQELYYGCTGDIETTAVNPIRDTFFFGWQEGYDAVGLVSNIGFGYFSMRDLASVAGSAAGEGRLTPERIEYYLEKSRNNLESDTVILGSTGRYDIIAENEGYTYFKMSDDSWALLEKEVGNNYDEIWKVNQQFIDEQIAANKNILLSNDPYIGYYFDNGAKRFYQREIDYIISQGYTFEPTIDGLWRAVRK